VIASALAWLLELVVAAQLEPLAAVPAVAAVERHPHGLASPVLAGSLLGGVDLSLATGVYGWPVDR
jgi:hypothetical protein